MIEIKNLTKSYGDLMVYKDFDLKLPLNKIICFLGPSGCGKTTLFNIIAGLEPYDSGAVLGTENLKFSYGFQDTRLLPWYTASENIQFVLKSIYEKDKAIEIANYYLEMVELSEYANYYPNQLSGGMKQRVALARAFAYPSNFLFMDEPFKGQDLKLKNTLIEAFLNLWKREPKTVWMVTHDIEEAKIIADIIITLEGRPVKIKEIIRK